jgi:PAS domain S-box-containing protein
MLDFTERRASEELLRRSEQRLELAQEAAAVGMWDFDFGGCVLQWSNTHHSLFGSQAATGDNMLDDFWRAVHAADRRRLRRELRDAVRRTSAIEVEYRIRRGDGSERWIASRGRVERDAEGQPRRFIGISTDITQAQHYQARLARSEELFRLAAEAVDGIIYEYDLEQGTVLRTRGMAELLGYQPELVPPTMQWWDDIVHPDDRTRVREQYGRAEASGAVRTESEYRVRHSLGYWVTLLDRAFLVRNDQGKVVRVVGCAEDITELRRVERSLREADRRKDEFLAILAHELRNPLAPMRNALQLLEASAAQPETSRYARSVLDRQLTQMVRLIDDLLDVARITSGKLALRRSTVLLSSLAQSAVETARPLIRERHHELRVHLPQSPVEVNCDEARISQVLSNLLNNAARYTPIGGLVELTAEADESEIVFEVRDNGVGIAPDALDSIFEMFAQGGVTPAAGHSGLGVGLPLSRSLIALHDGRLEAASAGHGHGTVFTVRLPRGAQQILSMPSHASLHTIDAVRSRKILVVDDNRDAADSLGELMRIAGHEARVCHDGLHALAMADAFRPDVVLLDIGMPRIDGHEVARRLRSQPWGRHMQIVALSGFGRPDDRQRSIDAGCDEHLTKPVSDGDLRRAISGPPPKSPAVTPREAGNAAVPAR